MMDDSEGFEAVQRRLLAKVQREMAANASHGDEAAVQTAMRKLFPNSFMCGKCSFGPVDHANCADLRTHHGEARGAGIRVSNACPKCGWFSGRITDWPPWVSSCAMLLALAVLAVCARCACAESLQRPCGRRTVSVLLCV